MVSNSLSTRIFEIKGAKHQQDKLYILLRKNSELNLNKGDPLLVIDKTDLTFMGQFEITEVLNTGYYAIGVKNIDSVWLGYMREKGETTMMPNIIAVYVPIGEEYDQQYSKTK